MTVTKEIFSEALGQAINEYEAMIAVMLEALEAGEKAIQELLDQIELVHRHPKYNATWDAGMHAVGPYNGPQYGAQITQARKVMRDFLLKAIKIAKGGIDEETKEKWLQKIRKG